MDEIRVFLGLVIILVMPLVIGFWCVIHGGSSIWRRQNPLLAYWIAAGANSIVFYACWTWRQELLGQDLGTSWPLFILGSLIYAASFALWRPVKQHLDFRTFAGIPEVNDEKIELIRSGPFAMIRHPRYFMVGVGVLGWCLMANYAGVYAVGLMSLLGLLVVIWLEEKDLVARFGQDYLDYKREVPAIIPSAGGIRKFVKEAYGI